MILEKIKDHFEGKKFTRITRKIGADSVEISRGYIVDYSNDFLVLQESDDFSVLGYNILPIDQIKTIRFNRNDQYYHKMMVWEGEAEKVGINYKIDLGSWQSVFKSIKEKGLNVIVRCEDPEIDTFTIGPIIKTGRKNVYIQYFDASGFWDEEPIKISLEDITKVNFDDRYINVFSKYLRHKRTKK